MIFSFVSSDFPKQEKQEKSIPPRVIVAFPSKSGPCEPRRVAISAPASPSFLLKTKNVKVQKEDYLAHYQSTGNIITATPKTYLPKTKFFKRKKLDRRLPRTEDLLLGGLLLEDESGVPAAKLTAEVLFSSDMFVQLFLKGILF